MPSLPSNSCWMRASSGRKRPCSSRNVQHADAAARFENPVQVFAVVVRFQERMPFGEQDPFQRRQGRIAEEELPLGQPRGQVQRLGIRLRGGLAPQVGRLGPFGGDVQTLLGQPVDQLVELDEHAFQRRQAGDAAPVRRPARFGRPLDQERRQVIVGRQVAPSRPFAQVRVLQEPIPALLGQAGDLKGRQPASPVLSRPLAFGDGLPLLPIRRNEHFEDLRDAVLELAGAVASDQDAGHRGRLGQFDLGPLAAAGRGDPTVVVPVLSIVQVLDLVDGVAGKQR